MCQFVKQAVQRCAVLWGDTRMMSLNGASKPDLESMIKLSYVLTSTS